MAKKNIADKYWIYGEDAELAARLTSYLTRVVYNQRANYIRALMKIKEHECSIEDCDSDIESQSMRSGNSLEESILLPPKQNWSHRHCCAVTMILIRTRQTHRATKSGI